MTSSNCATWTQPIEDSQFIPCTDDNLETIVYIFFTTEASALRICMNFPCKWIQHSSLHFIIWLTNMAQPRVPRKTLRSCFTVWWGHYPRRRTEYSTTLWQTYSFKKKSPNWKAANVEPNQYLVVDRSSNLPQTCHIMEFVKNLRLHTLLPRKQHNSW